MSSYGGDSSSVRKQLKNVQQIRACGGSYGGFAAILGDGSVVTWGSPSHGGNSNSVQDQLRGFQGV